MSFVQIGNLQINEKGNIFTWEITQDFSLLKKHKVVVSNTFNFSNDDQKKFQLVLRYCERNPNPINCQISSGCSCNDVWRLFLRCIEQDSLIDPWKCEITVLKKSYTYIQRIDDIFRVFRPDSEEAILYMCPNQIVDLSYMKILCKLILFKNDIVNKELGATFNFESMFLDKKFSDILLRTKCGKEIPAHRILLANASPVFEAMFSHDMLENKNQLVDIVDISYDTAVEMLRYIYTGGFKTEEFSTTVELLVAADKYQLQELKKKCERTLSFKLSTENAVDTLRIADTYGTKYLKRKTVDFFKRQLMGTQTLDDMIDMLLGKKGNKT